MSELLDSKLISPGAGDRVLGGVIYTSLWGEGVGAGIGGVPWPGGVHGTAEVWGLNGDPWGFMGDFCTGDP